MSDEPAVLVVDDEVRLADLFTTWIESRWPVATAYDGDEALEKLSDAIDVVLLDRRMPGLSGDEVLAKIREAGYDCRVVMVTAVDPDFDIIEMGFDDYLVKPVTKADLHTVIEAVLERSTYAAAIQEYYALVSKRALLEAEKSAHELANHTEYRTLCERADELRERVDGSVSKLSTHDDFVGAFHDLDSENR